MRTDKFQTATHLFLEPGERFKKEDSDSWSF